MNSISRRSILGGLLAAPVMVNSMSPAIAGGARLSSAAKPAVFFVPHQDDELLIMGSAIRNHVLSGREVHVILLGRGDGTSVRTRKMPGLLGYTPSGEEIGRVRDREYRNTLWRLGVRSYRHIPSYEHRMAEKSFTVDGALSIMRDYLAVLPGADCKSVSMHDINPDHSALGLALQELWRNGEIIHEPRYYVAPWCRNKVPHPRLSAERAAMPARADHFYRHTDVANDDWGVGYKSVRSYFEDWAKNPASLRHK